METPKLLNLIDQKESHIDQYLGDVTTAEFIEDVKELLAVNINKQIIQQTIDKLNSLI